MGVYRPSSRSVARGGIMSVMDIDRFYYATVSLAFQTDAIDMRNYNSLSVQAGFTSSIAGTMTVEVSNDKSAWFSLTDTAQSFTGPGNALVDVTGIKSFFARVSFTVTSGTSTISISAAKKG